MTSLVPARGVKAEECVVMFHGDHIAVCNGMRVAMHRRPGAIEPNQTTRFQWFESVEGLLNFRVDTLLHSFDGELTEQFSLKTMLRYAGK